MRWLSIEGVRSQARCLMTEWELLHQVQQLLQSVANEHFERRQGCPGREMPTSLSSPADGFSCESKQLPILGTFLTFSVSIYDSASPFSVFCQFSQFGHFNFSKLVTAITQTVQKIGSAQPFINHPIGRLLTNEKIHHCFHKRYLAMWTWRSKALQ